MPGSGWGSGPWLATGLLGLALVLGTGSPSSAASPTVSSAGQAPVLSLSLDGQHWAPQLDRPLFDGDRRWVPGDTETVSVWVRNLAATEAALDLSLAADDPSWPAADLDLSARIDGKPVRTSRGSKDRHLDPMARPVRVDLTVTMSRRARERAEQRRTPFSVRLRLNELGSAAAASSAITSDQALLPGLSEPVGGHVLGHGAPPFGVPLTLVAVAVALRAAVIGRRSLRTRKAVSCPNP